MSHGEYTALPLTRESVQKAHEVIKSYVHRTPVETSHSLNAMISNPPENLKVLASQTSSNLSNKLRYELYFKCENFQKIGAFKARGAFFNVMTLDEADAQKGVCTHSSGNHAQALALAARTRGIPAHIVMPSISTPSKMAATKGYGAHVHLSGSTSSEREAALADVKSATGATFIPPYDYLGTILGQGTVALELEQQVSELKSPTSKEVTLDAVIAPLGGGGLLGGVATALSEPDADGHKPLVYGAEPSHEGADDARRGLTSDPPKRIEHVKSLTIADGLRTPVGILNWTIISDKSKVAGVFSVNDEQIKAATRLLLERLKVFVEPSAAVGLAVVLFDQGFRRECEENAAAAGRTTWRIGIILSGGNTTVEAMAGFFGSGAKIESTLRAESKQGALGDAVAEDVAG